MRSSKYYVTASLQATPPTEITHNYTIASLHVLFTWRSKNRTRELVRRTSTKLFGRPSPKLHRKRQCFAKGVFAQAVEFFQSPRQVTRREGFIQNAVRKIYVAAFKVQCMQVVYINSIRISCSLNVLG